PGIEWDKKRLERLDRNLRKLERALQRKENSNEPPVLIEPDPEVIALQATVDILARKLDDQEAAIKRLNGDLEQAHFNARNLGNANLELSKKVGTLEVRLAELEARLTSAEKAAQPPAPPTATGNPTTDFNSAMGMMMGGDYDGAALAFETFIKTYPDSPQINEAWFRLGETRFIRDDHAQAAVSYATALRGWPKTQWAPDATAKLAVSLRNLGRTKETCAALSEFDKRYAGSASTAIKARANQARTAAKCG
ncbi:MAG: tetratricopeptide repeat protein, partial [Asticcacaulis sp.]